MTKLLRPLLAVAATMALSLPAFAATLHNPAGLWTTPGKESRYEFSLCGDGDELCVRLVWLSEGATNGKTRKYLNQTIIDTIKRVTSQKWRGRVNILGRTVNGSVEIVAYDRIVVRGCEGPLCADIELTRVQ